nr:MAG TPA: hypothetical protein [Caudoviricetes sp.]
MTWLILCVVIIIVIGAFCIFCGLEDDVGIVCIFGAFFLLVGILGGFELKNFSYNNSYDTKYIPAEPIAYNSTQTVFATNKGNIIVNGVYPDGVYMLDMDGDTVLVVWQAVEGEEVGLG